MRRGSIVVIWIFASLISVANATVTVSRVPTGGTSATVTLLGDGRYRVELSTTVTAQPTTFTIKGGTFDELEDVLITANVPQIVFIEIEGLIPTNGLDSVEDINSFTSTATVILRKANVLNDVASIRLNTILGTNIQGDITGDINLIERNGGGPSTLISMDVGGDVLGDVLVNFGDITRLAVEGSIGTVANRSTISVGNSLKSIVADEIHADITTPVAFSTKQIKTTGVSSNGDFTGSLDTNRLVSFGESDAGISIAGHLKANLDFAGFVAVPIEVGGNLTGDIDITEDLRDEILIRIEGSLASAGSITLGTDGLIGQIIINAGDGAGTWIGNVTVGSTTLSPEPRYTQLASNLGGGAVGEARFDFHKTESEPDYDSTVTVAIPTQVEIFHYGPVHRVGLPVAGVVTVDKRPITGGDWEDVSEDFVVDGATTHTGLVREIRVKPTVGNAFEDEMEYRIAPVTGKLKCDLVDDCPVDCPDVSWEDDYFKFKIDIT